MSRESRIKQILTESLRPTYLEIEDQSDAHKGHKGTHDNGETHYQVTISTQLFSNKSKLESHRVINKLLNEEFQSGLHALSIKIV